MVPQFSLNPAVFGEKSGIGGGKGQGQIVDRRRGALVQIQGLGHIADTGLTRRRNPAVAAEIDFAGVRKLPQNGAQQSGFACPIPTDEGGQLSTVRVEADIPQQNFSAQRDADLFDF